MSNIDKIYADKLEAKADFVFDEKVAAVFPDMLARSIPGYGAIISMIETLTARYAQTDSNLYDLGCSLAASSRAMLKGLKVKKAKIIAVDNSQAMIEKCRASNFEVREGVELEFICDDLLNVNISDASVVILNFTLQFVNPAARCDLLNRIWQGMRSDGILILSEKVRFDDKNVDEMLFDIHHAFKRANGYSQLEISQKRAALEKVLLPETIKQHRDRLIRAGFKSADVWFQCFNFMSMLAIK